MSKPSGFKTLLADIKKSPLRKFPLGASKSPLCTRGADDCSRDVYVMPLCRDSVPGEATESTSVRACGLGIGGGCALLAVGNVLHCLFTSTKIKSKTPPSAW